MNSKKHMKPILTKRAKWLYCLVISSAFYNSPIFANNIMEQDNIIYELQINESANSRTATVIRCTTGGKITIPEKVTYEEQFYTVNALADNSFSDNYTVTSVILPKTLSSIGTETFSNCMQLKSVSFAAPIEKIPTRAFYNCPAIEMDLSKWLKYDNLEIGEQAFACELAETIHSTLIVIPNNISIASNSFDGRTFTSVEDHIGANLDLSKTEILKLINMQGEYPYDRIYTPSAPVLTSLIVDNAYYPSLYDCTSLQTLRISKAKNSIQFPNTPLLTSAEINQSPLPQFSACPSLLHLTLTSIDSEVKIPGTIFPALTTLITKDIQSLKIDNAGDNLGTAKFEGMIDYLNINNSKIACLTEKDMIYAKNIRIEKCPNIQYLKLPVIERLSDSSIHDCTNLKEIYLGKTLKFIDARNGIYSNKSFTTIIYGGSLQSWFNDIDFNDSSNGQDYDERGIFNNKVTHFYYGHGDSKSELLTELNADNSQNIKRIPFGALTGYKGIESVELPESVKEIGHHAFAWCTNLKSISITGVDSIPQFAFWNTKALEDIYLGRTLRYIGPAFYPSAHPYGFNIHFQSTFWTWMTIQRAQVAKNGYFGVDIPEHRASSDIVHIAGGRIRLHCQGIIIHDPGVLVIPEEQTTIGNILAGDTELHTVIINAGSKAQIFREGAFRNCTSLHTIKYVQNVKDGEKKVGFYLCAEALKGCTALTNNGILDNLEFVEQEALHDTPWWNEQPDGIVYLNLNNGKAAYAVKSSVDESGNISDISTLNLHTDTKFILPYAFKEQTKLTRVRFPDGLEYIGKGAFSGCSYLQDILIPSNVTYLGNGAFGVIISPAPDSPYLYGEASVRVDDSPNLLRAEGRNQPNFSYEEELNNWIFPLAKLDLYIGRDIEGLYLDNASFIQSLTFGPMVKNINPGMIPFICNKITCLATEPPICNDNDTLHNSTYDISDSEATPLFSQQMYSSCTLYVPETSLELYRNAPGWSGFLNIETFDLSQSHDIYSDLLNNNTDAEYFDLTGRKVSPETKGYIIKRQPNGMTSKYRNI